MAISQFVKKKNKKTKKHQVKENTRKIRRYSETNQNKKKQKMYQNLWDVVKQCKARNLQL